MSLSLSLRLELNHFQQVNDKLLPIIDHYQWQQFDRPQSSHQVVKVMSGVKRFGVNYWNWLDRDQNRNQNWASAETQLGYSVCVRTWWRLVRKAIKIHDTDRQLNCENLVKMLKFIQIIRVFSNTFASLFNFCTVFNHIRFIYAHIHEMWTSFGFIGNVVMTVRCPLATIQRKLPGPNWRWDNCHCHFHKFYPVESNVLYLYYVEPKGAEKKPIRIEAGQLQLQQFSLTTRSARFVTHCGYYRKCFCHTV